MENHEERLTSLEKSGTGSGSGSGGTGGSGGGSGDEVLQYFTSPAEFPNVGDSNVLYIVTSFGEESIYRWDDVELKYYLLSNNYENILTISGGNANGLACLVSGQSA